MKYVVAKMLLMYATVVTLPEGKKRMKSIGKINIPQEAFIEVLKAQ